MEGTTQGDLAAMVIYATAIRPLILMLVQITMQDNIHTKTAAYADDLTVAGPIDQIRIFFLYKYYIFLNQNYSHQALYFECTWESTNKNLPKSQTDMVILNRINYC